MQIDLEKMSFKQPVQYYRNGKPCLFDPIRQRLIQVTPEELVRQKFIQYLTDELSVPLYMINTEVPVSRFYKGTSGRVDIVVYGNRRDNLVEPVLIVECKADHIPLTEGVFDQVFRYDEVVQADTVAVTNGQVAFVASWDEGEKRYRSLQNLPTYDKLLQKGNLQLTDFTIIPRIRPAFEDLKKMEVIQQYIDKATIGEDTDKELYGFIMNLGSCLMDTDEILEPQDLGGLKLVQDGGIRFTDYGNAAGGSYAGEYRYFVIEEGVEHQLISISFFGTLKCTDHPVWGTRKGYTSLVVAIDDFERSHNSLQLNVDKHVVSEADKYRVYHDGSLTVGNRGRMKNRDVIDFIKQAAPELIQGQKVYLGSLDKNREARINHPEVKDLLGRIMKYAILRDAFRREGKGNGMRLDNE